MNIGTKQGGFSLLTSVILFVALTIVGLSVMRSGVLSEKQSANIQEKSVTFHSAQSSNNATIESYRYDENILVSSVDAGDTGLDTCINHNGVVTMNCTIASSIDAANGVVLAKTKTVYKECLKAQKCTGNSAGVFSQNTVGCNVFQHDAEGWIDSNSNGARDSNETATNIEQWSLLVSACE